MVSSRVDVDGVRSMCRAARDSPIVPAPMSVILVGDVDAMALVLV